MRRPPTRPYRPTAGSTLVELLVALAVAGLALVLAGRLFGVAAEGSDRVETGRVALDHESNARRWLAVAFGNLDVGTDGAGAFEGGPSSVSFSTWLETADGWLERRPVTCRLRDGRLIADAGGRTVVLADGVSEAAFDYLLEPGADTRWVRGWSSAVSAPLAVRVRLTRRSGGRRSMGPMVRDTMLYLIRERG